MSILIKGTKMPQGCFSADRICFAYDGVECHCRLAPNKIIHFSARVKNERPSWCPLIEIPPHGRLIDVEDMDLVMFEAKYSDEYEGKFIITEDEIYALPTIIESEEEDAEYRPITADELLLAVRDACDNLVEHGATPHEVVFDSMFEGILRAGAVLVDIPFDEMTLFGLKFRFDNLPDGVEFIVS